MALLLVFGIVTLGGLLFFLKTSPTEDPYTIALIAPTTGPYQVDGTMMITGVQFYLDQVNEAGGINGRPVELLICHELRGDALSKAEQEQACGAVDPEFQAKSLVQNEKVLAVLGYFFSTNAIAAAEVYENKMALVTGTATADAVTLGHDWVFRTIPSSYVTGSILADYSKRILKHQNVGIIHDSSDVYSQSLQEGFKLPFLGQGGVIEEDWQWTLTPQSTEGDIQQIVRKVLQNRNALDLIFIASQQNEAEKLILSLRRKGVDIPIFGGNAIGKTTFAQRFNKYPEEQTQPGYFTDGIHAAAPIMFGVLGKKGQHFAEKYYEKFGNEPNWVAVGAYDAAKAVVDAIRKTNIQGLPTTLQEDRKKIKEHLASITSLEKAIEGETEKLYFDKEGSAIQSITIGLFEQQHYIPGLNQFQLADVSLTTDIEADLEKGHLLTMNGRYMHKTNMVYTGVEFVEVSNLNEATSDYRVEFYLWFRSTPGVDAAAIQFTNALSPPDMVEMTDKRTLDHGVEYRLFRVKGEFSSVFDFHDYPFDKQQLAIRFHHKTLKRENLVYVVDVVGMKQKRVEHLEEESEDSLVFKTGGDWLLKASERFFQDFVVTQSTLGNPQFFGVDFKTEYSRFNAIFPIERNSIGFIIRNLLPVLFVISLAYLSFYLPRDDFATRNGLLSGAILTVAFFHYGLSGNLPGIGYTVALDMAFYAIYGLIVFGLLLTIREWHKQLLNERLNTNNEDLQEQAYAPSKTNEQIARNLKLIQKNEVLGNRLNWLGRLSFPLTIALLCLAFSYKYDLFPSPLALLNPITQKIRPPEIVEYKGEKSILRLGSWRVDDVERMKRILNKFHASHPNIIVQFEPSIGSRYEKITRLQLKSGNGPDLFYLSPPGGPIVPLPLFEGGHLEPLKDIEGLDLKSKFSAKTQGPWSTKEGLPYAVPIIAVSHGIYYNQDLFQKLNLPIPQSWEDLIQSAQSLKEANIIPFANGSYPQEKRRTGVLTVMNMAPSFLGGNEGRLKYSAGERCFNDKHMLSLFQAIEDLGPFLPENHRTLSYYDSQQLFLQGKAAMWMGGSWDIASFEASQPSFQWSVFAVPSLQGQPSYVNYHIDAAIGLNKASPHKEAAKKFLIWLTQSEFAEAIASELPGFFPVSEGEHYIENQHAKEFLALNEGRGTDVRWNFPSGLPSWRDLMQNGAVAVLSQEMTPQEAVDHLQNGLSEWYRPAQRCAR